MKIKIIEATLPTTGIKFSKRQRAVSKSCLAVFLKAMTMALKMSLKVCFKSNGNSFHVRIVSVFSERNV